MIDSFLACSSRCFGAIWWAGVDSFAWALRRTPTLTLPRSTRGGDKIAFARGGEKRAGEEHRGEYGARAGDDYPMAEREGAVFDEELGRDGFVDGNGAEGAVGGE